MTVEQWQEIVLALLEANDGCCGCNVTKGLTAEQEQAVVELERSRA